MYKYIFKNVSSKYNKINMYKNNIYYGNSVFSVINNESVIHNLYILEKFSEETIMEIYYCFKQKI